MRIISIPAVLLLLIAGATVLPTNHKAVAEGVGEQLGKKIDQGVTQLGSNLRQTWEEIRNAGDRMGVQARVYARIHWDKAVQNSTIDIDVSKDGTVVLKGSVANVAAKRKAAQLASETVGVQQVVDQLTIVPAGADTVPARHAPQQSQH